MLLNTTNKTNVYGIVGILLQYWGSIPSCAMYYSTSKLLEEILLHSLVNSAIVEPFQVLYKQPCNPFMSKFNSSTTSYIYIYRNRNRKNRNSKKLIT